MQGQRQAKAGKGLAKAGIDRVGKGRFSSEFSQALELCIKLFLSSII